MKVTYDDQTWKNSSLALIHHDVLVKVTSYFFSPTVGPVSQSLFPTCLPKQFLHFSGPHENEKYPRSKTPLCVPDEETRGQNNTGASRSDKFDSNAVKTHQNRKSLLQTLQASFEHLRPPPPPAPSAFLIDPLPINIQTRAGTYPQAGPRKTSPEKLR